MESFNVESFNARSTTSSSSVGAPAWRNNFHEFIRILSDNFGPFDSVGSGSAENTISNLVMDSSKPIANYIAHFNAAATLVGWDDNAL